MKTKDLIVLVIGSHPDDAELGCAGTIYVLVELGYTVICIILSRGERGGDPLVRVEEGKAALALLGVEPKHIFFGHFADTRIPANSETITFVEQFVDHRVQAALIPSIHEAHQDHVNTHRACMAALRNVPTLLAYEGPSVTTEFAPTVFVKIRDHLHRKWRSLQCHASQVAQRRTYLEYSAIMRTARFRGTQGRADAAEAFEALRLSLPWAIRVNSR